MSTALLKAIAFLFALGVTVALVAYIWPIVFPTH